MIKQISISVKYIEKKFTFVLANHDEIKVFCI